VDVASGVCTSVIDVTGRGRLDECLVTSNSKYFVIWENFVNDESANVSKRVGAKVNLFDLQQLQNASRPYTAPVSEHLVSILFYFNM